MSVLIPPHRLGETENLLARAPGGEHVINVESEHWTRDGRCIDVSLAISPVWDEAGEIVGTSAIVRDITARKTTEQALAASEALLQVAFENAAIGMIMTSPDGQTLRVNRALCQMLGYSAEALHATSFSAFTHPDDIELDRVFMVRALAGEIHSCEWEKRFLHRDGTIVWGQLNASLARDSDGSPRYFISQIQDILVSNGVKFTEQGSVHVSAGNTSDGVAVSVRDTGIGIASEDLPRIFEAFRQVDSRLAQWHGGAGLGIAIARKLAELMSRTMTVESTPGKGSAFTLSLPASPPAAGSPSLVDAFPAVTPASRVSSLSPSA